MSNLAKRLKIDDYDDRKINSLMAEITCEYCELSILNGELWEHMANHRQGLYKFDSENTGFDPEKVLLPWYVHSIYQDRSVNRSRFEVIQFTELTRDSHLFEFEKKITKSFASHFWLNFSEEKTGDLVKDYFGLNPRVVSYRISGTRSVASTHTRFSSETIQANFQCCFCKKLLRRCTTLVQTLVSILIHALSAHKNNKALYEASLEDLKAIQESTGIKMYMDEVPKYNPLMAIDMLFDVFYGSEIFVPTTAHISIIPTYCLMCFHLFDIMRVDKFNSDHSNKIHKANIVYQNSKIACITTSRYKHPVAIACKHQLNYLLLVFNEELDEFSWACIVCKCTLKHMDPTQLIMLVLTHSSSKLGNCQTSIQDAHSNRVASGLFFNTANNLCEPLNHCRSEISSWNTTLLQPLMTSKVLDTFLKLTFRQLSDLLYPVTNKTVGFVEICADLQQKKRVAGKNSLSSIHVCPFCFQYFLDRRQVFLHMQPGECAKLKNFNVRLDSTELKKALKVVE